MDKENNNDSHKIKETPVVMKEAGESKENLEKGKKEKTGKDDKKPVAKKLSRKKKGVLKLTRGKAYVQSTYNNTIVTITDLNGNVIAWESSGAVGFKGAKKSTPYAAGVIVKSLMEKVRNTGLKQVDVFVKGIGSGREAAVRALGIEGLTVNIIKDLTPTPHNGCRPKKIRRV